MHELRDFRRETKNKIDLMKDAHMQTQIFPNIWKPHIEN